ncbi:MAG TPA: M28 family peptidase, partial [Candidatus Marinimicrobia bacterium]|nr:M28 family peptidase [Candidatus Neomarinimicrobiota bacterium]
AEILSRQQPPRTIYLVFFDGEDYGFPGTLDYYCLGSEYFAKNLPIPKPEEAIIIDMIGDADLRIPVERNSVKSHPQLIKKLWAIADRHNFSAFVHQIDEEIYDDHLMLIQHAGIPSVDLIDFQYPNRFINYWHTTLDTPDKCSAESLEIVGTVLYDYIFYGSEER